MLNDRKILIAGPTSQVALPVARELSRRNEVWGLARFSREQDREPLERLGVHCFPADLAKTRLEGLPTDFDYVLNFAVVRTGDFDYDLAANAEGVGRLMFHCRSARAFLHCSSAAVYAYAGHEPRKESDPLGDNHRVMMPTYSICKIAAEAVVRFAARELDLPTTIARFSVPYGDNGGWPWFHLLMMQAGQPIPVHTQGPSLYNPIHEEDYIAQLPRMLEIAAVPATVINWGGQPTSIEDWCGVLSELTGLEPRFHYTDETLASLPLDLTRLHELVGKTTVGCQEGLRRMVKARNPELLRSTS
ncbi:MAG: NAD-dependent epimerase/dehydratase family protein [Myxococcota bacterium]